MLIKFEDTYIPHPMNDTRISELIENSKEVTIYMCHLAKCEPSDICSLCLFSGGSVEGYTESDKWEVYKRYMKSTEYMAWRL